MEYGYSVDEDNKIEIVINNHDPVELVDFVHTMAEIGANFNGFAVKELNEPQFECKLYIKEVRQGSIIVDLAASALPVLPILYDGGILNAWLEVFKITVERLINNTLDGMTKKELQQASRIFKPIAKDSASQININGVTGDVTINQIHVASDQAKAIVGNALKGLEKISEERIHTKQMMTWVQSRFKGNPKTGNKVIIQSIDPKAKNVYFADDNMKNKMQQEKGHFPSPWQDLAYIVDVEVNYLNDEVSSYKILNYYPDDTYDPNE